MPVANAACEILARGPNSPVANMGNCSQNLSAIILAGGESRRMGTDKAWLKWDGQSLITRAVDLVREAGAIEVFISGRPGADYSKLACPVLADLAPGNGPLGGIERGLFACRGSLLLVLAVDLPQMNSSFLKTLVGRCGDETGAVPVLNRLLEPLAAIYPKRAHSLASGLLSEGRYAARDFAERCLREKAVHAYPVTKADEPCFANWNCPGDLPGRGNCEKA